MNSSPEPSKIDRWKIKVRGIIERLNSGTITIRKAQLLLGVFKGDLALWKLELLAVSQAERAGIRRIASVNKNAVAEYEALVKELRMAVREAVKRKRAA